MMDLGKKRGIFEDVETCAYLRRYALSFGSMRKMLTWVCMYPVLQYGTSRRCALYLDRHLRFNLVRKITLNHIFEFVTTYLGSISSIMEFTLYLLSGHSPGTNIHRYCPRVCLGATSLTVAQFLPTSLNSIVLRRDYS
jgi:hypothetical protein